MLVYFQKNYCFAHIEIIPLFQNSLLSAKQSYPKAIFMLFLSYPAPSIFYPAPSIGINYFTMLPYNFATQACDLGVGGYVEDINISDIFSVSNSPGLDIRAYCFCPVYRSVIP